MGFRKAKQNRIFQDIVEQIQLAIVNGELAAGEKLPSERKMCSTFATSRGTLREALRILEQKKLLTIKLGAHGGAIVRKPNSELIAENFSLLIKGKRATVSQLLGISADVAGQLATQAATEANNKDVGPLKKLVATLTRAMDTKKGKREILFTIDSLLFEELTRIGKNPLYGFLLEAALRTISELNQDESAVNEVRLNRHYQEIRMIVYAIAQNDRKQAGTLTRKHILSLTAPTK